MMMPYRRLPKRFTIEMVHKIAMLVNSLPKQNGIHSIVSPREIVTGRKFRCPTIRIGQYVQGHTGGPNNTDVERSIDALFLGRADNGSGHVVFKLSTKQSVSVNRVTEIPTSEATIKVANDIGENEYQPEGIGFSDIHGRVTLDDFATNMEDDDSNASDDDFEMDDEYQDELKTEIALEKEEGIIANDDPDSQDDYFQNPIQQHESNVRDNNEPPSVVVQGRNRSNVNPIVALANTTTPAKKQECVKLKKKKEVEFNEETTLLDADLENDLVATTDNTKVGVSAIDDSVEDC
jgi:hypothetical protein